MLQLLNDKDFDLISGGGNKPPKHPKPPTTTTTTTTTGSLTQDQEVAQFGNTGMIGGGVTITF